MKAKNGDSQKFLHRNMRMFSKKCYLLHIFYTLSTYFLHVTVTILPARNPADWGTWIKTNFLSVAH